MDNERNKIGRGEKEEEEEEEKKHPLKREKKINFGDWWWWPRKSPPEREERQLGPANLIESRRLLMQRLRFLDSTLFALPAHCLRRFRFTFFRRPVLS